MLRSRPRLLHYLGGSGNDQGFSIAVSSSGNAYVTGLTKAASPYRRRYQRAHGGSHDAFVTKVSVDGSALAYSTYLGGSGEEFAFASRWTLRQCLRDRMSTGSFPTTGGAYQKTMGVGSSTPTDEAECYRLGSGLLDLLGRQRARTLVGASR